MVSSTVSSGWLTLMLAESAPADSGNPLPVKGGS